MLKAIDINDQKEIIIIVETVSENLKLTIIICLSADEG